MGCQVLFGLMHVPITEGSACQQHFGMAMTWLPYMAVLAAFSYALWRWYVPRPR